MAELIYDETGRLLFTEEMREEYTILMPQMLPIHFSFLRNLLANEGYKVELLTSTSPQIVQEGLQAVHNDTCYPALLVIGQMLEALKSGKYDLHKVALIITQTGGGCRASNYIQLLRKALKRNGLEFIPVISFNIAGMEKNPGFNLNKDFIKKAVQACVYGDMLMWLSNQTRPYEIETGTTDKLVALWVEKLSREVSDDASIKKKRVYAHLEEIAKDFSLIPMDRTEEKIKVGIVGEIYVKYAPLGNNNLERFLQDEGAEVVVPGLLDFVLYSTDANIIEQKLFGGKFKKAIIFKFLQEFILSFQRKMIKILKDYPEFSPVFSFENTEKEVKGYVSRGNKMGEGWLLTGEMLELIHSGVNNIVCTQPFGCLPNHIVGKGMIRKIRTEHPEANIVAIDFDPGATKINQENRIKLMLAMARRKQEQKEKGLA